VRQVFRTSSFVGSRLAGVLLGVVLVAGSLGCAGKKVRAPYGTPPTWAELERGVAPRVDGLLLDDAKIRRKGVGANLLVLAQRPSRFAATIQIAGQELVSVAAHEGGYTLRWSGDEGLAPGFYEGQDPSCAIETLLGVELSAEELVTVLLGGAPLVGEVRSGSESRDPSALQIRKQSWDRAAPGHETVELVGNGYVQRLRFRWLGGAWVFAGTTIWRLDETTRGTDETPRARWLVTINHEAFTTVEGIALPSRIVVAAPGAKGKREEIAIVVRHADVDPQVLYAGDTGSGDGGDGWDDDGGWEDDEEATEASNEPSAETSSDSVASDTTGATDTTDTADADGVQTPGDPATRPTSDTTSAPTATPPRSALPKAFRLEPGGSRVRGDACRR
jgi:hypothetical protein